MFVVPCYRGVGTAKPAQGAVGARVKEGDLAMSSAQNVARWARPKQPFERLRCRRATFPVPSAAALSFSGAL